MSKRRRHPSAGFDARLFRYYSWLWFYLPHLFGREDTRRLEMVQEEMFR